MTELHSKMTALADAVREKAELTDSLTIDEMTAAVSSLVVNGVEVDARTLTVTPSKATQNFTSSELGENAYYETVTVNAIPDEYIITSDATATANDIVNGKFAYGKDGKIWGSLTESSIHRSANEISVYEGYLKSTQKIVVGTIFSEPFIYPGTEDLEIPADSYIVAGCTVKGDANLLPENIVANEQIFNVRGTFSADATAWDQDILEGKTAYNSGQKVTGSIKTVEPEFINQKKRVRISKGYINDDVVIDLTTLSEDATATVWDILEGQTAYVKGELITGVIPVDPEVYVSGNRISIPRGYQSREINYDVGNYYAAESITPSTEDQNIPADSYIASDVTIKGDAALISENIRDGVSIFGVSGTFTGGGGGVNRLYISSGGGPDNRLFAELPGAFNMGSMQVPARRGVYNDIHAVNGSLWFARNGEIGEFRYRSRKVSSDAGWTLARGGVAVKDWKLYAITGDSGNDDLSFSLFPDSPSNVTQLGFSYDGRRWCLSGNTAYIMCPHAGECKPAALAGVSVIKLLNQGMGTGWNYTYSQAALSTSGRALLLWGEHLEDGEPQAAHCEYVGNDVSFVNYFFQEHEDDGMGGGTYRLALKSDGTLYAQNASSLENTWQPVSGAPKFRTENCLGFCAYSGQEDFETGEMKYVETHAALHIAQDGTLWKISCDNTGVSVAQLDDSTEWIYVPPELGRNSKSYAQCDGILYVIESDSSANMNITWRKCYIQPAGKLIATSHDDSFLWFTEEYDKMDVTGLGVL